MPNLGFETVVIIKQETTAGVKSQLVNQNGFQAFILH